MNLAPSSRTGIGRERATVRAYTTLKQDLLDLPFIMLADIA